MSGHLCLKWNNHNSAFEKLLNNLHLKEMYSDATLVCHGKFYPVHRFVLTTCSDYFEEIFYRCVKLSNKHPFIIVKDINPIQMEALLNYMYKGEVNVPQEMLPELIKAAEAFKIKGLAVPDEEPPRRPSKRRANTSSPVPQSRKSRKYEHRSELIDSNIDDINSEVVDGDSHSNSKASAGASEDIKQNLGNEDIYGAETLPITEVKSEPIELLDNIGESTSNKSESSIKDEQPFDTFAEEYPPYNENEDDPGLDDHFDAAQSSTWENSQDFEGNESIEGDPSQRMSMELSASAQADSIPRANSSKDEGHSCPMCPYKGKTLGRHMRTHTGERPYSCPYCPYRASQKVTLNNHVATHTGEKRWRCHDCEFKTSRKSTLRHHMAGQH